MVEGKLIYAVINVDGMESYKQYLTVIMAQFQNRVYYDKEAYFQTKSGNFINKRGLIKGSDHIQISGRTIIHEKLIIRGDLAQITMGKYVMLLEGVIIKPSYKKTGGKIKFTPVQIGDYVFIDKNTIIQAAKIGSYTRIGKDCIIGQRSLISDNVIISDGSIVPPDTTIPSYSIYSGKPSLYTAELPECCNIMQKDFCISYYNNFTKREKSKDVKPGSTASGNASLTDSKVSGTSSRVSETSSKNAKS